MRVFRLPGLPSRCGACAAAFVAIAVLGLGRARAESCRSEVGERRAARLVEHCIQVSPATHPPCHADNACALIRSEIARGCRMIDDGSAPAFCARD